MVNDTRNSDFFLNHSLFICGITSAGSSIIVQFLYGLGLNQLASVLLVQLITDYGDRLLSVIIVTAVIAALPKRSFITK